MLKKYLVTGASGFVGSHLARRLVKEGQDVHILLREESNTWRINDFIKDVQVHQVDLTDPFSVKAVIKKIQPQIVFHLAAYGVCPGQHDAVRSGMVNTMGTINLVDALMKTGTYECMVNTGSTAEYGWKDKPMVETDPYTPNTEYGATKAGASFFCEAMSRLKGEKIINLKLMSPYGPYDELNRLIPAVIKKCLAGKDPELSKGDEARSFFYMDDLMDLYLLIPDKEWQPGEIVIAGPDRQYTVKDIAEAIIRLTGANVKPLYGAFPPRAFDTNYWVADITKIRNLFGWEPQTTIDQGLLKTIEWYRDAEVLKDESMVNTC